MKANTTLVTLGLRSLQQQTVQMPSRAQHQPQRKAENEICDEGAQALCEVLRANTTLTELDLSGLTTTTTTKQGKPQAEHQPQCYAENEISGEGACALCGALKVNTTLETLHLEGEHKEQEKLNISHYNEQSREQDLC